MAPDGIGGATGQVAGDVHPVWGFQEDDLGSQGSAVEPAAGGGHRDGVAEPVGAGAWTVSQPTDRRGDTIPVAASGGWLDGGALRAEIIFLETPHRMDISCDLAGRTAAAVWRHPPLVPSKLQHLHCPR